MECNTGIWPSNDEYLKAFSLKVERLRIPFSGSLDLTHRCNLSCVHCYIGGHSSCLKKKEMNTGQLLSVIDEITEAGCLYLLITGGEPLLRKDFTEIYSRAKNNGLLVTVFTNGTAVTEEILDLFGDLPPSEVEISLYGATAATYEKITRIPGSYERCLSGIKHLLNRGIPLSLKTILMTINSHEFFSIRSIAKEFGVKFRFDAVITPCLNGNKAPLSLRVSPREAVEKEFTDEEQAMKWKKYFSKIQGQEMSDTMYHCGAGVAMFHIDPYGNLQPCHMVSHISYNIAGGGFLKGWHDNICGKLHKKAEGDVLQCNKCEKIYMCGFCPAFFELENGAEHIRSDYFCAMGSERLKHIKNLQEQGVYDAA